MSTTSSAWNYLMLGLNPMQGPDRLRGRVLPVLTVKMASFDDGNKLEEEDDEANIGTSTNLWGKDRTNAEAAPEWENKIRLNEEIEDLVYMLLGSHDTAAPAVTGATIAKKWRFFKDEVNKPDLCPATLVQGMNVPNAQPDAFVECILNTLDITWDADKAPKFKASMASNFPLYNQAEPTIVTPGAVEWAFKAQQTSIYMGNVGDNLTTLKQDSNKVDCYLEANTEMSNNIETSTCGGTGFGEKSKDEGGFTAKGKIKMNYNDYSMFLEALVATGAVNGTNVSQESVYRQLLFESIGKKIETVVGTPNIDVFSTVSVLLPKAKLGLPKRTRSGKDPATVEMEYEVVSNGISTPAEITMITPKTALDYGTAPP